MDISHRGAERFEREGCAFVLFVIHFRLFLQKDDSTMCSVVSSVTKSLMVLGVGMHSVEAFSFES